MRLKILLTLVILMTSSMAMSQTYSNDKYKFVKEFQKSLSGYGKGEFHDFVKKEFPDLLLESTDFPDSYFSKMVETCNKIEFKKLKTYPDVYNYVYSVSAFVKKNQTAKSYNAWHSSIDKLLPGRNTKKLSEFLQMSAALFSESRISESSSFSWYYIGGTFEFIYTNKSFVNFEGGNLVCRIVKKGSEITSGILDGINVIKTSGKYDPKLKKWIGHGGKITWEKVDLDSNKTFANINNYDLSLKKSTLRIDSVEIITPYFDEAIEGRMVDRAFKVNREEDKVYPQFVSFKRRLVIENIIPNIDYIGGFSIEGSRFIGAGTNTDKVQIILKNKNNKPFIIAKAKDIYVKPDKITISNSIVSMYFDTGDSLYHPRVNFNYDLEKKKIQLTRPKSGLGQAPFEDSYHQLDIYVPRVTWDVDADNVHFTYEFGTSQERKVASFESKSYFDDQVYENLQAQSSTHPLVALSRYCYKYDQYIISEGAASLALGMTISQAKSILFRLSNLGFITYDTDSKMVTINQKLEHFVSAKSGFKDYDNIVFTSDFRPRVLRGYSDDQIKNDSYLQSLQMLYKKQNEERRIKESFAILNLTTLDLDLEAIDNVVLSVSKNTIIYPNNSKVKVKQNRNFNFSGWINAGKLEVNTRLANFEYDNYKLNLLSTDQTLFRLKPLREEDGTRSIAMASNLTGISGEILIDAPENKSGNKSEFDYYPKLISKTSTKVFYDSKDIHRGVYDSTRFYYSVLPFELDSLNTFKESAFRLKGELTSAQIFPKIKEDLKIMPDYSFGFSTNAPDEGYNFYETETKYKNQIVLSNNGLQGLGSIKFVHSTSISNSFTFLPDSAVGFAQFENIPIETDVEFPDVTAKDAYVTYVPKQQILRVRSTPNNKMTFFNQDARFRGTVTIRPKGMTGSGLMTFVNASLASDNFRYKRYDIYTDSSRFNLENESSDFEEYPLVFKSDNVNAHISFKERNGIFKSNEGDSFVEFPMNQYLCRMDQFTWLIDELSIEIQKKEETQNNINSEVDFVRPNFLSTHSKQDSLKFRAAYAKFDLKEKTIYCQKVEYLDIADARIYPDSMKLNIRKKAKIDKLINAKIVANYTTKYHKFEKADVQINARRDYSASGQYQYYDKDSNVSYIPMSNIGLDSSYQTIASGKITSDINFKLSEKFDYYGDVSICASNPLISFNGATRINHSCEEFDRNWMAFTSDINPENIQIPVTDKMKDLEGRAISAGIVWRDSPLTDSIALYPTFLSALVEEDDPIVMTSKGYLQYSYDSNEFQIASKEKLINHGEKGNYIALQTESCSMNGDGIISLGMDYGNVGVDAVGTISYDQQKGETSMDITARFDMDLDKRLMQNVASKINAIEGLYPMDLNSTTLEQAIVTWSGKQAADKVKDEYARLGTLKRVPDEINKSMTVTGLHLSSFNNDKLQDKGLITNVKSAVLVNLYGKPVMKYIPFNAFFQQIYSKSGGDKFSTLMSIPGGHDYFFHYSMDKKNGTLKIQTGDQELNTALTEMKEEKRKKKNFMFEATENTVYLAKFMNLFK